MIIFPSFEIFFSRTPFALFDLFGHVDDVVFGDYPSILSSNMFLIHVVFVYEMNHRWFHVRAIGTCTYKII